MATKSPTLRGINRVAARIEQDIVNRRLAPGDRYLTAKELADFFGYSPATCHRAMKLLADRDVLSRRPNSGTFVGPKAETQTPSPTQVRSVYVLLSSDVGLGAFSRDGVMEGLWRQLPGVGLNFAILPAGNEVGYMEELLSVAAASGQLYGVVAISCPREVYTYLSKQNLPVVVLGSVEPTEENLASVDGDEREAGKLLADHLLGKGYRQFAVLMRELWRSGDNLFFEGVQESLHRAALPLGALCVRSLPYDQRIFNQRVRTLLAEATAPVGLICEGSQFAAWLDALRATEPEHNWDRVGIAYNSEVELSEASVPPHAYTFLKSTLAEMVAMAGKMMAQLAAGKELPQRHVMLPFALCDGSVPRKDSGHG